MADLNKSLSARLRHLQHDGLSPENVENEVEHIKADLAAQDRAQRGGLLTRLFRWLKTKVAG